MNKAALEVRFYRTDSGTEPVRDWLRALPAIDRKRIGEDIKTVQYGWPLIKKSQATPKSELQLAKNRMRSTQ